MILICRIRFLLLISFLLILTSFISEQYVHTHVLYKRASISSFCNSIFVFDEAAKAYYAHLKPICLKRKWSHSQSLRVNSWTHSLFLTVSLRIAIKIFRDELLAISLNCAVSKSQSRRQEKSTNNIENTEQIVSQKVLHVINFWRHEKDEVCVYATVEINETIVTNEYEWRKIREAKDARKRMSSKWDVCENWFQQRVSLELLHSLSSSS